MRALVFVLLAGSAPRYGSDLEAQLEREVIALGQTVRRLEAEATSCDETAPPDRLFAELTQVFAGTEVAVTRVGRTTRLRIPTALLFRSSGSRKVRDEAAMTVDLLGMALSVNSEHRIRIVGHTSDRSLPAGDRPFSSNLDLSLFEAATFAELLIAGSDVDPARLEVAGRGAWEPLASNDLPSGQDQNRRIEVFITPPEG
jgi:chemotaxis protein MotB